MSCRCEFVDERAISKLVPSRPIFTEPDPLLSAFPELRKRLVADTRKVEAGETKARQRKAHEEAGARDQEARARKHEKDRQAARFADAMGDLNSLVGLAPVKEQLQRVTDVVEIQTIRAARGMPAPSTSHHMAFVGPPGTGKTTVARLVGELYAALGVLSDGHLVETNRTGLIGEYIGHTGGKTSALIDSAIGGVLFIDEAYTLTQPESERDFGREAVDTLAKRMENEREKFLVIVAGYPNEMTRFLHSIPGFPSRFKRTIDFPPYSGSELLQILQRMASAAGYDVSDDTASKAQRVLAHAAALSPRTFGNARAVRNVLERAIEHHASRIMRTGELDDVSLRRLVPEDVPDSMS